MDEAGKVQDWGSWGCLEALPGPQECPTMTPALLPASQETCSLPLVTSTLRPSRMNNSTWSSLPRPTSGERALHRSFLLRDALPLFLLILSRT